jgi:hypothetical protein
MRTFVALSRKKTKLQSFFAVRRLAAAQGPLRAQAGGRRLFKDSPASKHR